MNYRLSKNGVILMHDDGKRVFIPNSSTNVDWLRFQGWVKTNTPLPDTSSVAEELYQITQRSIRNEVISNFPSWVRVQSAVDSIANLADAKAYLSRLSRVVYLLAKSKLD